MTRFGFFLFNILLVAFIYLPVYFSGAKTATVSYVLQNFSEPYILLILIMVIVSTIRWFMSHDPDVGVEIVTWANALWIVPVLTVLSLYLLGALQPSQFMENLHTLMSAR